MGLIAVIAFESRNRVLIYEIICLITGEHLQLHSFAFCFTAMDTATKQSDIVCSQTLADTEAANFEKHSDSVSFDTSEAAEKVLLRKLDLHIVPMEMVLYLAAFLDR